MQPCEAARPIDQATFVSWIAIGPFSTQVSRSASEWAEMPSACEPNGPLASGST